MNRYQTHSPARPVCIDTSRDVAYVRMESMSHGGEIFGLGGDTASEPSFETALRGYEKKQVERYVARAENEIAALAAEREQAYQQIQAMAGQIDRLQQEVTQARRQTGIGTEVSFR